MKLRKLFERAVRVKRELSHPYCAAVIVAAGTANRMKKSRLITMIISLLAAIALWIYVVTVVNPDGNTTLTNVPVTFSGQEALQADQNLIITKGADATVTVDFSGKNSDLKKLEQGQDEVTAVVDVSKIRTAKDYNMTTLRRLEKLGFVAISEREVYRSPIELPAEPAGMPELTGEQQAAFDGLMAQAREQTPGVALLYGVTGSGKTAVYIRLIYAALAAGKSAVLLVPEIALTPQLLGRLTAHFGDQVAVLHSSLRVGERFDEWRRLREGKARVAVGTRSAVFAPVQNPGLFIVDEEQEHTYKSENAPRYHAREVAILRGARAGALVLLGSATPSVESMKQDIKSLTLPELKDAFRALGEPAFRAGQVFAWLWRGAESFEEMTNLSKSLRDRLDGLYFISRPAAARKQVSQKDGTVKYLWRLGDGNCVESVVMDLVLKEQLPLAFPDFKPYLGQCQFPDCVHRREPGCAVRAALERGEVEPTRYESYLKLLELAETVKPWEHRE